MHRSILSVVFAALAFGAVTTVRTGAAAEGAEAAAETAAVRELLEGQSGRQEAWMTAPELVVLTSVLEYSTSDPTAGYRAGAERLSHEEASTLADDMNAALDALTGGVMTDFKNVRFETADAGSVVKVFRKGQIIVGRYEGVQKQAGMLGYGGRTARAGTITSAAVFLDRDFDVASTDRRLLRTHELGHALGYNHVESRRSVMNPRVGSEITDFDRRAIRIAFPARLDRAPLEAGVTPSLLVQN